MNRDPEFWKKSAAVKADMATWLTVHGNLCLALRHPKNRGASREITIHFVKELGQFLVETGAMSKSELETLERVEAEEGSKEFRKP